MPRQPLSRFAVNAHYSINHDSLASRPELASIIGRCISTWSQIDLQLSLVFAAILNITSEASVAVYFPCKMPEPNEMHWLPLPKLACQ